MSANDIAFSVVIKNDGISDIIFKTIMLKGDKGNSVDHVEKTSTSGLVDTYTIYLTDGTIGGTFTVTNGSPVNIDDTVTAVDKTWSSSKLSGMIKSIDDNVVNDDKLWSSQKINSMLAQTGTIEDVAIASFSDGADDVPLSDLVVDIEAWQEGSGEPSPDNERAIHGWNECNIIKSNTNLWDEQWELGGISSATGGNYSSNTNIRTTNYIPVKPNTTYYASIGTTTNIYLRYYKQDKTYINGNVQSGNTSFTTPADCFYLRFYIADTYGTTYGNDISINYPSTDTEYHAFDGGTDTISFGQMVFGGQLDVTRGKLHVTHTKSTLPEITEFSIGGGHQYVVYSPTGIENVGPTTNDIISSVLPAKTSIGDYFGCYHIVTNIVICVPDNYTVAEYNNEIVGSDMLYPLATPFDIDLTPTEVRTLLNANNIYADTGNIEKLVYFKTGSEAVAKLIEAYMRAQPEE